MKRNYLKQIIIVLFIIIFIFSFVKYLRRGHIAKYKINNKYIFEIVETRTRNEKKEMDSYYLDIKVNDVSFSYQLFDDFNSKHKIVSNIYYFKDKEYTCIYPVLYENVNVDIKCLKDDIFYYYSNIKGTDEKLDQFASSLKEYDIKKYTNDDSKSTSLANIKIYLNNLASDYNIAITNLKGIYVISSASDNIKIFDKDIYNRPLSVMTSEYYVTADYNEKHQFRNFYLVNLISNKKYTVTADEYISFNSYIQGVVDNCVYIYDIDNEKQYKLSLNNRKISEVRNKQNKVTYYQNNEWTDISVTRANNTTLFTMNINSKDFADYDLVYKYGYELSGYYYLYKKLDNGLYALYRTPLQDIEKIEYLFEVNNIDTVIYLDDYVYFNIDNSIYYYSQKTGLRKIIDYNELKFNENILYGVAKVK